MSLPRASELTVGDVVATSVVVLDRGRLVRYAGASGDFNPIHWNERFALAVGLPGVIGHGMLTMGSAVSVIEQWLDDPGAILDYQSRFTRPVPVPDDGHASVEITATIGVVDVEALTARVDLTATFEGARVLGKAQVLVRLGR